MIIDKSKGSIAKHYFLSMAIFLNIDISQDSEATCLRRVAYLNTTLLQSLTVKEF